MSVNNIHICVNRGEGKDDYHTIFVNCKVGVGPDSGFNYWGKSSDGVYKKLITRIVEDCSWSVATIRDIKDDDKTFLNLKGRTCGTAMAVLRFGIDKVTVG